MGGKRKTLLGLVSVLVFLTGCSPSKNSHFDLEKITESRPSKREYLFDYAGVLEEAKEYANGYLNSIRERYRIEAMIVSFPSLGEDNVVEETAARVLSNWKIGKDFGRRGLLLFFADREKQVKLEVSYELEDVFTDAFCGYIADLQLRPSFLEGRLGIGLLAVMEEIERRAQIKHQANYSLREIDELDRELLSGGAGARRDLSKLQKEKVKEVGWKYPAGKTPEEAWQTLIQSWQDKARDPNLGVYTEITKLVYRDYQNLPDSRYEKDYQTYHKKPFEVIKNEKYGVIFFGNKKGWENSPFLFCRTPEGWKFDIVHQRKYIRHGPSPDWGVERTDYPYIDLLSRCPYYMGQDIPLESKDIYRVEEDKKTADRIRKLEAAYQKNPDDFEIAMALGRLYTITAMGPKHFSLLNKARRLNPQNPTPHKYLAIAHVGTTYQYQSPATEMREYTKKKPDDVFGHNFLGYLYLQLGDYRKAIREFEQAVQLNPDNAYGYCKLSRCYGGLYLQASKTDFQKEGYRELAIRMFKRAKDTPSENSRRVDWLRYWLKKKGVLSVKS